jgi:hypothetical protein
VLQKTKVTALALSNNGALIAAAHGGGDVYLYSRKTRELQWCAETVGGLPGNTISEDLHFAISNTILIVVS